MWKVPRSGAERQCIFEINGNRSSNEIQSKSHSKIKSGGCDESRNVAIRSIDDGNNVDETVADPWLDGMKIKTI